ncbi:MAG TPA: class I SAM-dependent methyltransferase [bacterium]|nr:class I SAM-dependent methyltransferase [bacterium]
MRTTIRNFLKVICSGIIREELRMVLYEKNGIIAKLEEENEKKRQKISFLREYIRARDRAGTVCSYDREELETELKAKLCSAEVVLDIGCGIRPQRLIRAKTHICCDPHLEYLEKLVPPLGEGSPLCHVFINADWEQVLALFPPRSVDSVFLLDVIEHLQKEKAKELIDRTLVLARKQVVVFTPLGYMSQEEEGETDAWGLGGMKWQKHRSGWTPEDFSAGWDIYRCDKYHTHDSRNNHLPKPFGAFYAVKTNN